MKMTKKFILASFVLPLVLSAGYALASEGKGHHKSDHEQCRPGLNRELMKELELTDAQKEQFKTLREANREERKNDSKGDPELRKEAEEQKLEQLNALLLADKFDPAEATKLAQGMVEKKIEREVSMLNKQYQMISILTPEQKAKFVELQEEHLDQCTEEMPHGKNRK